MDGILGVDGGNTKTIAVIAARDGTILGSGRSGCGDMYAYPSPEPALEQIEQAISVALIQAGIKRDNLLAGCFSLAGADWSEDYEYLSGALTQRGFGRIIEVYNDAIGALRAGSPDGTGVVIACGTGAAIAARNRAGEFWHASFWLESLCGRELGYQAIRAVKRVELGMSPPTSLTDHVLAFFGQPTVEQLLHHFYKYPLNPPSDMEVSKLAPMVLHEAEAGDPVAAQIVLNHGERLADYALVAARKVGIDQTAFPLILNGGIFRHRGNALVDAILQRMTQSVPGIVAVRSGYEPVIGALLLAFEAAGITVDTELKRRLEATLPHTSLFAT